MAFMLEKVEMAQPLDLGIVDWVLARRLGVSKAAARRKIDVDGKPALPGIEVDRLHEPGSGDAQCCRKQLVTCHCCPPALVFRPVTALEDATSTARLSLWICGRRAEDGRCCPRVAAHKSTGSTTAPSIPNEQNPPTQDSKEADFLCCDRAMLHGIVRREPFHKSKAF